MLITFYYNKCERVVIPSILQKNDQYRTYTKPYLTFASLMNEFLICVLWFESRLTLLCSSAKSLCRLGMLLLKFLALFIIYNKKRIWFWRHINICSSILRCGISMVSCHSYSAIMWGFSATLTNHYLRPQLSCLLTLGRLWGEVRKQYQTSSIGLRSTWWNRVIDIFWKGLNIVTKTKKKKCLT